MMFISHFGTATGTYVGKVTLILIVGTRWG